jgi:anti-sigma factor RsiW
MIDHETELKLQALVDGELPSTEAAAIGEVAVRNAETRALIEELKATRTLLAGNELEMPLPESPDFYWSQIRRRIEHEEQSPSGDRTDEAVLSRWWIRFLAPAGVLAALLVLVVVALRHSTPPEPALAMEDSHEIETPLEETSSFSFRSEADAMTVVWVDSHRE